MAKIYHFEAVFEVREFYFFQITLEESYCCGIILEGSIMEFFYGTLSNWVELIKIY